METLTCRVDNRTFLFGLDELYRKAMKPHERAELLDCARRLCADLRVQPRERPVEGYYGEDAALEEYFLRMRELQEVQAKRAGEVRETAAMERLLEVTSSGIYGHRPMGDGLFPTRMDALTDALSETPMGDWSIGTLTSRAYEIARNGDDYSLVALAALACDPVVLTALRESVVLYAGVVCGAAPMKYEYVWEVDPGLAARAVKFVEAFNALFGEDLPAPVAVNARAYFDAAKPHGSHGRCVRIGYDDSVEPTRHYHWAIKAGRENLVAVEFWDTKVWTTGRFKEDRYSRGAPVMTEATDFRAGEG